MTDIYGLFSECSEEIDLHRVMTELYTKKIFASDAEGFVVLSPLSDILRTIINSKKCVVMQRKTLGHPVRCCYLTKDHVVVTEKSQREQNTLRIYQMQADDWIAFVLAEIEDEFFEIQLILQDTRREYVYASLRIQETGIQKRIFCEKEEQQVEYQRKIMSSKLQEWIGEKI
ncbi:MAG: hypothetical protein J6A75_11560, partial [Lachnospiraceae bacterium]|nr:hypothetical protein [Lachnospiraceae bacterium]